MQHVKIKYSEKPYLKDDAGFFGRALYKFHVWRDNRRYDYYDRQRKNVTLRFAIMFAILFGLIVYQAVNMRNVTTAATELNTALPFGTQGRNVKVTSRVFNRKTGTLLVGLKFTDSGNNLVSDVNMKDFKITASGKKIKSGTKVNVPTSENTMVVKVTNLNTDFRTLDLKVKDNSLDVSGLQTESSISSSESTSKKHTDKPQVAEIVVSNDHSLKVNNNLTATSQKSLVMAQTKIEVADEKKVIAHNKSVINKWEKAIADREQSIKNTRKNMTTMSADELSQAKDLIASSQSSINDLRTNIASAKSAIDASNDKIKLLNKAYVKQQNGTLNVPKPY